MENLRTVNFKAYMDANNLKSRRRMIKTSSATNLDKNEFSVKNAEYHSIRCEICSEPFHIRKRLPKLLPCEHNFCEQCIFSLCCHQQYYLLDSINCPTCHTEFNTSTALAATTNYGLCQLLEAIQVQQIGTSSDANITVIHVPDNNCIMRNRLFYHQKDDDDCLRVVCLECCVNRHNGHKLVTLNELEHEHQKLIGDLRTLQQSIQKINKWIEASLKVLSEDPVMSAIDFTALCKAKQNLRNECEADMKFALSVLENGDTTPLPPTALQRMRQHQYHNSARLHKLLHFIEKCNQSIKQRCNRSIKVDTSTSHSSLFSVGHQTRITLCNSASDDRSAAEAIAAILAVALNRRSRNGSRNRMAVVEEAMKVMSKKSSTKTVRRAALLCCAKQLREFIDESISAQSILLYIDAYLHIFYQLNNLVTRFPSDDDSEDIAVVTRWDIWKLIQVVYSDLMRYAAKYWESDGSERVDLVDDLAFLCSLYSDVSDEATITICMIEAARARAAVAAGAVAISATTVSNSCEKMSGSEDDRRITMNIRLNLIDEHLLECRRVQKLQRLRAATVTRHQKCARQQSLKGLWKLLSTCFDRFSQHQ
ncbi:hypothetical protein LOAG_01045 [Loa loa]|uniref:RING-type domain-containing protein n=1 Tax=Loa loa TaxID=7209 RepID=A0A1S0UBZ1_LOALO|nr:hypothetical protein LOAG_01045 [Loa loa]EFO27439.2 hypothetical protein LOAG_01045 [Loa loa]